MKTFRLFILLFVLTGLSHQLQAQDKPLLKSVPVSKEGFVSSEKVFLNTVDWLEHTPVDQEQEKRGKLSSLVVQWLTNSPMVTIQIDAHVLSFTEKNPSLLVTFMGGWGRYALENAYSTDSLQGNLAGLRAVTRVYKQDAAMKKDKEVEKLVALDNKGELERWLREQLAKNKARSGESARHR